MKKVLVADDTKNIRTLLSKCLQMEGYEVKTANDGYEARDILLSEGFDLAFIDIKMPLLSGTEVIKEIREKGVQIPVIVITAYATVKNAIECTQMGTVAYLQKPFTAGKVKAVLNEFFQGQDIEQEKYSVTTDDIEALIEKGLYSRALELLKTMNAKEPDDPAFYLLLSKAFKGLGDEQKADRFFKAYLIFSGKSSS
jgi:DNA-binding NtrC family response regulator